MLEFEPLKITPTKIELISLSLNYLLYVDKLLIRKMFSGVNFFDDSVDTEVEDLLKNRNTIKSSRIQ